MQASSSKTDVGLLDALAQGTNWWIEWCYQFYYSSKLPKPMVDWSPLGQVVEIPPNIIEEIDDERLKQLFETLTTQEKELNEVNQEGAVAFSTFLKQPLPSTGEGLLLMGLAVNKIRKRKGAIWLDQENFQSLLAKLQPVLVNMRETTEVIAARLEELYSSGHYERPITGEDIGDQRADDLIDSAVEEEDSKRKVQLLRRALRYGKTGVLASKAYLVLGMTYEDLGNAKQAIKHYTNSMEAWKPFATAFFFRGGVYFQLEEWEKAHSDFEQALAFEGGLDSIQREELEQYMARILEKRNV